MSAAPESTACALRRRQRSSAQLTMIRRTVARELTEPEFDLFLEVADTAALDPLRRQIVPLVMSPEDAERRRVIPWTTIDGLRVIAARAGDYRPMEEVPILEADPARADPATNPLGLVRAEVRVFKRSGDVWRPVAGEAWWDEYAPVSQRRVRDEGGGAATSVIELDPSWRRMARLMLAKCAEAQALRRGWPDLLSGLYSEDELHRLWREAENVRTQAAIGAPNRFGRGPANRTDGAADGYLLAVNIGGPLESIACTALPDRLTALYRDAQSIDEIDALEAINRATLQSFWSRSPADAMAIKTLAEERRAELLNAAAGAPGEHEVPDAIGSAPEGRASRQATAPRGRGKDRTGRTQTKQRSGRGRGSRGKARGPT